jgi:hypothetical protein
MDDPTDLNDAQRARADALVIAGRLLGTKAPLGQSTLPEHRSTTDLVDLANFILDGHHPLEGWHEDGPTQRAAVLQGLPRLSTPGENPVGDGRPEGPEFDD